MSEQFVWSKWLENPGDGKNPLPKWVKDYSVLLRYGSILSPNSSISIRWRLNEMHGDVTHYCYSIDPDLYWVAKNEDEWRASRTVGGDNALIYRRPDIDFKNDVPAYCEPYSFTATEVPQKRFTKEQWERTRKDFVFETNPEEETMNNDEELDLAQILEETAEHLRNGENPAKYFEYSGCCGWEQPNSLMALISVFGKTAIRRKERTININGVEVPAGITTLPKTKKECYAIDDALSGNWDVCYFINRELQFNPEKDTLITVFENGMLYTDKEKRDEAAQAIIDVFSGKKES